MKKILLITALSLIGQFGLATKSGSNKDEFDFDGLSRCLGGFSSENFGTNRNRDCEEVFSRFLKKLKATSGFNDLSIEQELRLVLESNKRGKRRLIASVVKKSISCVDGDSLILILKLSNGKNNKNLIESELMRNHEELKTETLGIWGMALVTGSRKLLEFAKEEAASLRYPSEYSYSFCPNDCLVYPCSFLVKIFRDQIFKKGTKEEGKNFNKFVSLFNQEYEKARRQAK